MVVSTAELEARLQPLYDRLRIAQGQLEVLTGIHERRWWEPTTRSGRGGRRGPRRRSPPPTSSPTTSTCSSTPACAGSSSSRLRPATSPAALGINPKAAFTTVSNACLGVLNGIVDIANRIELGQMPGRPGRVLRDCPRHQRTDDRADDRSNPNMDMFKSSLATLTGGSGAVAVLRDRRIVLPASAAGKLLGRHDAGGRPASWPVPLGPGVEAVVHAAAPARQILSGRVCLALAIPSQSRTRLGPERRRPRLKAWPLPGPDSAGPADMVDKVICHQVGAGHREAILKASASRPKRTTRRSRTSATWAPCRCR